MTQSVREIRAKLTEQLAAANDYYEELVAACVRRGGYNMPTLRGVAIHRGLDVNALKTYRRNAMSAARLAREQSQANDQHE